MKITKLKQPEEIMSGDLIAVINEDTEFGLLYNKFFVLGLIDKTRNNERYYQCLDDNGDVKILHDRDTGPEEYWTKREFINVVRRNKLGEKIYYEIEKSDEQEEGFWESLLIGFLGE